MNINKELERIMSMMERPVETSVSTLNPEQRRIVQQAYDSLKECRVDPEGFDFGPAYELARQRRKDAMQGLKRMLVGGA